MENNLDRISVVNEGINFRAKHRCNPLVVLQNVVISLVFAVFFVFATLNFVKGRKHCVTSCELNVCSPYILLALVYAAVCLGLLYSKIVKRYFGQFLWNNLIEPVVEFLRKTLASALPKKILSLVIVGLIGTLIFFETRDDFHRLRSLIGVFFFILIGFVFSVDKFAIKWRPVLCGFTLQLLLGILCIRWDVGRTVFKCLGDRVVAFLSYAQEGSVFVFGNFLVYDQYTFAFAILPTVFFFSFTVSILYYLGAMQWLLKNLGWMLQSFMGTTVCESVNAAGNIFLGQTESPMLIRPYIRYLTHSEIHAIIVSGFATVSGTTLAAYISYGAEPYHLITASVMAAPASLFFSKLFYPETEDSLTTSENISLEKSADTSLLDAASNGAKNGIGIYLNIIANLVAFIAFFAFTDNVLKWTFHLIGFKDLGVAFFLGKLFIPVSWALGVEWTDCEAIGNVIGQKTFVNEFVAYRLLGDYTRSGEISHRSSAIATYAICGFGNPSAMGIIIGALSALAPERRPAIVKVAFRAFIAGCIVPMITACLAGLLMTDEIILHLYDDTTFNNKTLKFLPN